MFETLDKVMLAGLGALAMTKERAGKIFEDYVARGQAERGNRSGFVKEIMDNAEKARKEMQKLVSEQVQAAIKKLNLASQEDIHRLEKKLDKLLSQEP
jgi:polyhydroxyalkanoate synthesis regulator phasin